MLPILKIIFSEMLNSAPASRTPEPEVMNDANQIESYVRAYEWGGPTSALQLHHLKELGILIRSGDTVVDLACGPGPLLLELAELYPDCSFIGVDLSPLMLANLEARAKSRNLKNIRTLLCDIRILNRALLDGGADLVISTSAMHHLPLEDDLEKVFKTIHAIQKKEAGVYIFDFGLLKSPKTRHFFVNELRKTAPPLTVQDYEVSLNACFPLSTVFRIANQCLPRPLWITRSFFVDFFYFIQSPPRTRQNELVSKKIKEIWKSFNFELKLEHIMLRLLRRRKLMS